MRIPLLGLFLNVQSELVGIPPPGAPPEMPPSLRFKEIPVKRNAPKFRPMRFLPRGISDGSLPTRRMDSKETRFNSEKL